MDAIDEGRVRALLARFTWELDAPERRSLTEYCTPDARITVREVDGSVVEFSAQDGTLDDYIDYRRARAWLHDRQQWALDILVTGDAERAVAEATVFDLGWAKGVRSNVILSSHVVADELAKVDGHWRLAHRDIRPAGAGQNAELGK